METKKWAIAIASFGNQYSLVISSWETDQDGNRINQTNDNVIVNTIQEALEQATILVNK